MKTASGGMPGSIAACVVSWRLLPVNFATIMIPANKSGTKAFPSNEGLNDHGSRSNFCSTSEAGLTMFFIDVIPMALRKSGSGNGDAGFYPALAGGNPGGKESQFPVHLNRLTPSRTLLELRGSLGDAVPALEMWW